MHFDYVDDHQWNCQWKDLKRTPQLHDNPLSLGSIGNTTILHLHRHGERRCFLMTLQLIFKRLEIVLDRVKVVRIFPEEIGGVVRPILLQENLVFRTPPAQLNESERQCLTVADQWKVVVTRDEETEQNERVISEHAYKLIVD